MRCSREFKTSHHLYQHNVLGYTVPQAELASAAREVASYVIGSHLDICFDVHISVVVACRLGQNSNLTCAFYPTKFGVKKDKVNQGL